MPVFRLLPPWVVSLLGGLALLQFVSAVQVGFLSDDYLIVYYCDRDSGAVHWGRVGAEFTGPWFGVRDLYRPLVSLSYGVQLALHGMSSPWLHAANVAMLLVAALAIAALVQLRLPALRGSFAAGAGALLLLHPAAVEPGHWIAARTTGLELMFSALAMWAYAAFLYGRLRSRWPAFVLMGLALGSKEGAMMLAVSLTAIDLLCARGSPQARVQGLRPFWVLLFAYLLFRKLALGWFTTAREGIEPGAIAARLCEQIGWLLLPPGPFGWTALPMLAVLLWPLLRQRPWRCAMYLCWLVLQLLPTSHVDRGDAAFDGRLVCQALPVLALCCTEAAAAHRRMLLPLLAALGFALACVASSLALAAQYRAGGRTVAAFQQQLAAAATAGAAAPGRPLAPVAFAHPDVPLQLLQAELWGLLLQRPFAARDDAVAGLPEVLPQAGVRNAVDGDAGPAVAVLAAGGQLADFAGALRLHRAPAGAVRPSFASTAVPGRFAAAPPWQPLAFQVLEVRLPAPARRCRLGFALDFPPLTAPGERSVEAATPADRFWFDVGDMATGLLLHALGQPWPDAVLQVDGAPAPAGTELLLHDGPEPLPSPRLQGAVVRCEELATSLSPPEPEAELLVLLPTTAVVLRQHEGRLLVSGPAGDKIRFARAVLGSCLVHCCWRCGGGTAAPRRSDLDWFVLR